MRDGGFGLAESVDSVNHDVAEAVPADSDTIASCDSNEAFWVVMTQSAGHSLAKSGLVALKLFNRRFDQYPIAETSDQLIQTEGV